MKSAETLKGCSCPKVRVRYRAAGLITSMSRRLTGVDDPGTVGGRPRAVALAHANVEAVRPLTNTASATSDSLSFGACGR